MGSSNSVLTEEMLEEYTQLTYLGRGEILELWKRFFKLGKEQLEADFQYRFPIHQIEPLFPQLKYNPFCERIYDVFSSRKDKRFSFEDLLDFCSVMSEKCPDKVKAVWAFRLFDFDGDQQLGKHDIMKLIDTLTQGPDRNRVIDSRGKEAIVKELLLHLSLESSSNGGIGQMEFEHAIGKMSDFKHSFSFRI